MLATIQAEHLRPITTFRFLAAMGIVLMHAGSYWSWALPFRPPPFSHGVSFFFVLSGFILTHVYQRRQVSHGRFMWARFAKLWPTHLATLLLLLLIIREDSRQFYGTGFFSYAWTMSANLALVHSLVPFQIYSFSWNAVSWSISTEMFFYLAFPLLLVSLRTTWHLKLLGCAVFVILYDLSVSWADLPVTGPVDALNSTFIAYPSPLFRSAEFVVGMSAYVLSQGWRDAAVRPQVETALEFGVLVAAAAWFLWGYPNLRSYLDSVAPRMVLYWYGLAGSCFAFAAVLAVFSRGKGLIGRVLSVAPLVWLGQISFALYLVHQILMKWFYIQQLEGRAETWSPAIVLATCIGAAALLHHLVERPAQALLMGRWNPRQWPARSKALTPQPKLESPIR